MSNSCDFVGPELIGKGGSFLPNSFNSSKIKIQVITNKMLFTLPDFMASSNARKSDNHRPRPLHVSKSFSKIEPPASPDRSTRSQRASTIQNGGITKTVMSDKTNTSKGDMKPPTQPDAFEKSSGVDEVRSNADDVTGGKLPADFDELPIELVSLTDR